MVQAQAILSNPLAIVLIAIPLILQTYLIFWLTAQWMRLWGQPRTVAAPGAMIGASNFFELAVAGHQPVRLEFRRRPRHCGGRAGGGAGDVVAGGDR